jgi:hypothetical protein
MANVSITASSNVTVQQIPNITATTNPQSSGTVGTTFDVTGAALASSAALIMQIGISNDRAETNTISITVTDSHSNQSFVGQAKIDFADQDDSTVVVQFSDFPLQADQVTPMDKCDYRINLVGSSAGFQVFTV